MSVIKKFVYLLTALLFLDWRIGLQSPKY